MLGPFELAIGLRYLRAKRRNRFISVISLISMLGIGVGVMALITVLSVMNGFATELRTRILSMTAHAQVSGSEGRLVDWQGLRARLEGTPHLVGSAPFVQGEGMLSGGGRMSGVLVRGVVPALEPEVSDIADKFVAGRLTDLVPGEWGVVLGQELAWQLGVGVGDKVVLIISQGTVTPAGFVPRLRRLTVVGVFAVGMYEYDRSHALMHIEDAALLYGLGDAVSGVRLEFTDLFAAPARVRELSAALGPDLAWSDWTRQHVNFFRAIATEKRVMGVILFLIVIVAAINIISTLVMVVTEKQADIAILRTLGASPASVMQVFMVQGTLIGAVGTVLGTLAGVLLASNVERIVRGLEAVFGVEFLPADVYYINSLPSELHLGDVGMIAGVAFLMSFLSTLYPAWRAARTRPAEALRYE